MLSIGSVEAGCWMLDAGRGMQDGYTYPSRPIRPIPSYMS